MTLERPPGPWTLSVLEHFRGDPIVSLERTFPPTHALVRGVYLGAGRPETAVVEFELIDEPPPPTSVIYKGRYEDEAFGSVGSNKRLPWFPFVSETTVEVNLARLREHVRDCLALHGPKGKPPVAADEPEDLLRSLPETGAVKQAPRAAKPPPEPPPPPPLPGSSASDEGSSVPARPSSPPSAPRPSAPPSAPSSARRRSAPPRPASKSAPGKRRSSAPPRPPEPPKPERSPPSGGTLPSRNAAPPPPADPFSAPTLVAQRRPSAPPLPPEPPPPPDAFLGSPPPPPPRLSERPGSVPPPPPPPPKPASDPFDE